MHPSRLPALSIVFISAIFSVLSASCSERALVASPIRTQAPAGAAADTSLAAGYSQEVPLWPEGSQVLLDGIKKLVNEKGELTNYFGSKVLPTDASFLKAVE